MPKPGTNPTKFETREEFAKRVLKEMREETKRLNTQIARLETRIKSKRAELEAYDKAGAALRNGQ